MISKITEYGETDNQPQLVGGDQTERKKVTNNVFIEGTSINDVTFYYLMTYPPYIKYFTPWV